MEETTARNILALSPEADSRDLYAAYHRILVQSRQSDGSNDAALAGQLDAAREAFTTLRSRFNQESQPASESPSAQNTQNNVVGDVTSKLIATPVLWIILSLNVVIYLIVGLGPSGWSPSSDQLIAIGGNFPPYTTDGQWWRLLSSNYLHANLSHLVGNMFVLWYFGRVMEKIYGSTLFSVVYSAAGIAGSGATLGFIGAGIVSVGASGAIFGVLGLLLSFLALDRSFFTVAARWRLLVIAGLYSFVSLISGFTAVIVDNSGHVGGLIAGLVMGVIVGTPEQIAPEQAGWRANLRPLIAIAATLLVTVAIAVTAPRLGIDLQAYKRLQEATQAISEQDKKISEEFPVIAKRLEVNNSLRSEAIARIGQLANEYSSLQARIKGIEVRIKPLQDRKALLERFTTSRIEGLRQIEIAARLMDGNQADLAKNRFDEGSRMVAEIRKPYKWYE